MYMYILSAKIRIGKDRKVKKNYLMLPKFYYTSSVIPTVRTIVNYKEYKLGYKYVGGLFVQVVHTNNDKLLLRKGKNIYAERNS